MNMKLYFWCILMLSFFIAAPISVFALDCSGDIISEGDSASEVLGKCGQPTSATQREQVIIDHHSEERVITPVLIDDWIYNFGPDRFQYRIILRNGRVWQIESLDYGY
jgi:hypothetical protein